MCHIKRIFAVLFCLLIPVSLAAGSEEPSSQAETLSLLEFNREVMEYYPSLKGQDANIGIAIARQLQAFSGTLPSVKAGATWMISDDPVYVFGSLLRQHDFTSDDFSLSRLNTPRHRTNYNFSINAQWMLFDAFQTVMRVRASVLGKEAAVLEKKFAEEETRFLASGAYLSALAVDRNLEALNDIIRESEKDIKEAEDLKEKGLILGADFYLAKMIYGNLKMMRTKLEKEKTTARILMNIMAGAWYDRPLNLSGTLPETYNEPAALSEIIDEALKNRPDLVAMDMNVQAQKAELSREKLSFLPKVAGFGRVQENSNDLLSGGASYEVGVKTELDVFDPSYSGRVKEQKEKLRKLKRAKESLKDRISSDIVKEYYGYYSVVDSAPDLNGVLSDAKEAVSMMGPLYKEGRKSIADLMEIRQQYYKALEAHNNLLMAEKTMALKLRFVSGLLDEAVIIELNNEIGR